MNIAYVICFTLDTRIKTYRSIQDVGTFYATCNSYGLENNFRIWQQKTSEVNFASFYEQFSKPSRNPQRSWNVLKRHWKAVFSSTETRLIPHSNALGIVVWNRMEHPNLSTRLLKRPQIPWTDMWEVFKFTEKTFKTLPSSLKKHLEDRWISCKNK